jgi:hypothetical protein
MEEASIRGRIREMVRTGDLPCEDPVGTWGGKGHGKRCAACLEPIASNEVEFEVALASGKTMLLHLACHMIWLDECEPGSVSSV